MTMPTVAIFSWSCVLAYFNIGALITCIDEYYCPTRDIIDPITGRKRQITLLSHLCIIPFALPMFLILASVWFYSKSKALGLFLRLFLSQHSVTSLQRSGSMWKKRLVWAGILLALGGGLNKLDPVDMAIQWWKAPPEAPSNEAQRLIASLEDAHGWSIGKESTDSSTPSVYKGDLKVVIHTWHADILMNGISANGTFTHSETAAINKAAGKCLRRLTAQALEGASVTGNSGNKDVTKIRN